MLNWVTLAVAVYADGQTGTLDWATWTAGAGWVLQSDAAIAGKGETRSVQLLSFTNQDKILAVLTDGNSDLYAAIYDGATWTVTNSGSPLETGITTLDSRPFGFSISSQ